MLLVLLLLFTLAVIVATLAVLVADDVATDAAPVAVYLYSVATVA